MTSKDSGNLKLASPGFQREGQADKKRLGFNCMQTETAEKKHPAEICLNRKKVTCFNRTEGTAVQIPYFPQEAGIDDVKIDC